MLSPYEEIKSLWNKNEELRPVELKDRYKHKRPKLTEYAIHKNVTKYLRLGQEWRDIKKITKSNVKGRGVFYKLTHGTLESYNHIDFAKKRQETDKKKGAYNLIGDTGVWDSIFRNFFNNHSVYGLPPANETDEIEYEIFFTAMKKIDEGHTMLQKLAEMISLRKDSTDKQSLLELQSILIHDVFEYQIFQAINHLTTCCTPRSQLDPMAFSRLNHTVFLDDVKRSLIQLAVENNILPADYNFERKIFQGFNDAKQMYRDYIKSREQEYYNFMREELKKHKMVFEMQPKVEEVMGEMEKYAKKRFRKKLGQVTDTQWEEILSKFKSRLSKKMKIVRSIPLDKLKQIHPKVLRYPPDDIVVVSTKSMMESKDYEQNIDYCLQDALKNIELFEQESPNWHEAKGLDKELCQMNMIVESVGLRLIRGCYPKRCLRDDEKHRMRCKELIHRFGKEKVEIIIETIDKFVEQYGSIRNMVGDRRKSFPRCARYSLIWEELERRLGKRVRLKKEAKKGLSSERRNVC